MAVRQFNNGHTGDYLSATIPSALDTTGAFTWVFVVKLDSAANWSCLVGTRTTGPADRFTTEITASGFSPGDVSWSDFSGTPAGASAWTLVPADGWAIVVVAKPGGVTSAYTQSVYKSGAWTHDTTSNSVGDLATALGGPLNIGAYQASSDWLTGRMAAAAVWVGTALTTTQIATLNGGSVSAWSSVGGGPTEHWEMNQGAWATSVTGQKSVLNLTANGSGAIVTGDDPAGTIYNLAGGGGATVTAVAAVGAGKSTAPAVSGSGSGTVTAVAAAATGKSTAPAVSAGSTVTSVVADATGVAPPANGAISSEVGAVAAVGAGRATAPSVSGTGSATVTAVIAAATGKSTAPLVAASSTVTSVAGVAAGRSTAPAVSATGNATVTAPAAVAAGDASAPGVAGSSTSGCIFPSSALYPSSTLYPDECSGPGPATENHANTGGSYDQSGTGGIYDQSSTGGTVTTYLRGGRVTEPRRGGVIV